ncbi:class I SAM-dependent methyltransferase [Thalassobaculum sp. OXR-137]|uniref:class I SAM-dependent methyltransferase n=1 Tax=Thalassobaculum sp. OXR-137 TaxID=3100173 RepID=UPI002AC8C364|nr:class I SAM-dependent methyltransferase [Thalassobaculum sp. OXR-137]WPZ35775.1 class I SAM-dependent methyltransferase [Thalassobaculum sp. OXR-137]
MTNSIAQYVLQGDFRAASAVAREQGLPSYAELVRTAEFLSATAWLATDAPDPHIREEAERVLRAVAAISPRWVENAVPRAPVPELMPRTKAAFDSLMVRALGDRGYYHPVSLPGLDGPVPPSRFNAPDRSGAYHTTEWTLARPLLERACGGSLRDRVIVDAGCADGFFSLNLARAGARVVALDVAVTMALRTATFCALNGLGDRVTVQLGPAQDLPAILDRLRAAFPGLERVDAVCALGLIYHFDDMTGPLTALTGLGAPILFELHACPPEDEAAFDPAHHRNPEPVSLPWLSAWLRRSGFDTVPEPRWRAAAEALADRPRILRHEMLLALPAADRPAE